ncbi:hypothetical protein M413DRAFT_79160 [Hebeloma cylindrosporum]|uniref:3'-5' exonuclease domain-containing protein n=1 Tax=Hebeloma cylindrosporum TaxID=76867 RepID=A0A0C3BW96_HEBCY|nr:hypothetical protein M413DRAFT_79160 [Hebeloma cylindrosporum h7]
MALRHTVSLVDCIQTLNECISDISSSVYNAAPKLAVDLEGVELCRYGRISILQILAAHSTIIWLVDITTLGRVAFEHVDDAGRSLRSILQGGETKKLFYDVRNDADALWNLYDVDVANAYDLQVLEVAVRRSSRMHVKLVSGLAKTIDRYLSPPLEWQRVKEAGSKLFRPDLGGSYEVFEERPLDPRLAQYAAQDVSLLFQLEATLERQIGHWGVNWIGRVVTASARRVAESKGTNYSGHGMHRAKAPEI